MEAAPLGNTVKEMVTAGIEVQARWLAEFSLPVAKMRQTAVFAAG
jgi:hypothetical protein